MKALKKVMPSSVKMALQPGYKHYQAQKYKFILRRLGVSEKEILILATITKTGTHYFRFLLANYLRLLNDPLCGPAQRGEIDIMFPNGWHTTYQDIRPFKAPSALLRQLGLFDLPRSHMEFHEKGWSNSRVLHTYRNPLDFALFLYIFKFEYEEHTAGKYSGPMEVLNDYFDVFVGEYISFKRAALSPKNKLLSFSYEDLVRYPQLCLSTTVRWLGYEPKATLIDTAIAYSSERETAVIGSGELWTRNDTPIANPKMINEFTQKCLNEGSIGHWKNYFEDSDLKEIKTRLSNYGVELDEFTLSID